MKDVGKCLTVEHLLEYNRIIADAKKDQIMIKFVAVDISKPPVIEVEDGNIGSMGPLRTGSQAV